jgi:hypothetical protein
MAKNFALAICFAAVGLLWPSFAPSGFTLLVIDEQTGSGVPSLRVTDEDGMVRRTGSHGELIVWHRTAATKDGDRFRIEDDRDQYDAVATTLTVTAGGHATLKVHRRT